MPEEEERKDGDLGQVEAERDGGDSKNEEKEGAR